MTPLSRDIKFNTNPFIIAQNLGRSALAAAIWWENLDRTGLERFFLATDRFADLEQKANTLRKGRCKFMGSRDFRSDFSDAVLADGGIRTGNRALTCEIAGVTARRSDPTSRLMLRF